MTEKQTETEVKSEVESEGISFLSPGARWAVARASRSWDPSTVAVFALVVDAAEQLLRTAQRVVEMTDSAANQRGDALTALRAENEDLRLQLRCKIAARDEYRADRDAEVAKLEEQVESLELANTALKAKLAELNRATPVPIERATTGLPTAVIEPSNRFARSVPQAPTQAEAQAAVEACAGPMFEAMGGASVAGPTPEPADQPDPQDSATAAIWLTLDSDRAKGLLPVIPPPGLEQRVYWAKRRLQPYEAQSVVAAVVACMDGEPNQVIRGRFTPVASDAQLSALRPFLDFWAERLGGLSPMRLGEAKQELLDLLVGAGCAVKGGKR